MEDEMALFEAELGMMASAGEETLQDGEKKDAAERIDLSKLQDVATKRPRPDDTQEKASEKSLPKDAEMTSVANEPARTVEIGNIGAKRSLAKDAVRAWKKKRSEAEAAEAAAERAAWSEHRDTASGRSYYCNNITKKSAWTLPSDGKSPTWTVSKDASSGHLYYFNNESRQSTWQRPSDLGPETEAATTESKAAKNPSAEVGEESKAAISTTDLDRDVDEEFDLVAFTEPSTPSDSDQIYARVTAESEEGISVVGFTLRLSTPFSYLMEGWSEYQELPIESIYFELDGLVLSAAETPDMLGWTVEKGTLRIDAKPCEEVVEVDEKALQKEESQRDMLAKWKKQQQKQRRGAMKEHQEEQLRTGQHLQE